MIKIYHNSRCSKSRSGLAILEKSGKPFEIIKYLDQGISNKELKHIISLLNIKPIALVRKNESIWKELFKNKDLDDDAVIDAMVKYPKLIERPIVINKDKATIGRPPELIIELL